MVVASRDVVRSHDRSPLTSSLIVWNGWIRCHFISDSHQPVDQIVGMVSADALGHVAFAAIIRDHLPFARGHRMIPHLGRRDEFVRTEAVCLSVIPVEFVMHEQLRSTRGDQVE